MSSQPTGVGAAPRPPDEAAPWVRLVDGGRERGRNLRTGEVCSARVVLPD